MAKEENRGGKRRNSGAKKKAVEDLKVPVHCTFYVEQKKIDRKGKDVVKAIIRHAGQTEIDNTK